jgi:hypothetical protein
MNKIKQHKLVDINSKLVIFAFLMTVIFQITAYKAIWNLELVSRALNIATIIIFSAYAFISLHKNKFNEGVIYYYIVPGLMVYIGFFVNISINSISNLNVINQFGLMTPWAIYLCIPNLVKFRKLDVSSLWRYYNYFMLATVTLSIIEYYGIFSSLIIQRPIISSGGKFVAGYFSMLYAIESGELHYRFYASFMEPGTLAMFLLPAMAYVFFYRKYLSLVIYFIAMYLSDSLGGYIGLGILFSLLVYFRYRKNMTLAIVLVVLMLFYILTFHYENLLEKYENKGDSLTNRQTSFSGTLENLPLLVLTYPLGLPLTETTNEAENNKLYFGSNFAVGNAFNLGGILSFLGYLAVLFVSIRYATISFFRKDLSLDEQVAIVSIFCLIPFIFQRTVVWDSSLFALLFAPFIIKFLQASPRVIQTNKSDRLLKIN